jgi:hypothetical protein
MTMTSKRMRQLVDWSAALWAGLIAGALFLLLNLFLSPIGNAWAMLRLFASIILGEGILAPPATFDITALIAALVIHFGLSILYALLIAYVIHRGGLISGVIGGALLGLALYSINVYTLTLLYPWFFAMRGAIFITTHAIFGAVAGGIYEALEVEIFVPAEEA